MKIKSGYICSKCADKNNALWSPGHLATMHMGICDICNKKEYLAHTSDYNWPEQRELEKDREF